MKDPVEFRIEGRIDELSDERRALLIDRSLEPDPIVVDAVAGIIADVSGRGDQALCEMAERFDATTLPSIEVPRAAWEAALSRLPRELATALATARDRIAAFHCRQLPRAAEWEMGAGVRLGRRPEPLQTVGAYAPGGRAAYPSSVLMCVVPARLAGVAEVVVCSPPVAGGAPSDPVLAACALAGADRVFAIGGAGAVAALAYGTESVPRADKVVGPGNAYVTEAKRQLSGRIGSDCHAGPSEVLVVADGSADVEVVARELIAQAEHDPEAVVVAIVTEAEIAPRIHRALEELIEKQPRRDIIRESLRRAGALLVAEGIDEALAFATSFAPEHLLLVVRDPRAAMSRVTGAGSVFLGAPSSVVFGDYLSGANHVLPTGGHGRRQSGLSIEDFVRWSTYQEIDAAAAAELAHPTGIIATAEGLDGHAAAALAWSRPGAEVGPSRVPSPVRTRPNYAALTTYAPGRRPAEIDLSDNTNLFGQSPSARSVLEELEADDVRRYPSLYGGDLKVAAAKYFGVDEACVATGCGSDDLIDSTIRAFCAPTDSVAFPWPTFSMVEAFARMNGVAALRIDMAPGFEIDVDALAASGAQVVYICRPNNPTGNAASRSAVERLVEMAPGLVIIDEAYGDFFDEPLAGWAPHTDRVVVFRTMSKAFGLAGLRVGIAIGPSELIAEIEKSRGPYKVSVAAEQAAAAALRDDAEWVRSTVTEAVATRERLAAALSELGLCVFPSAANFLLLKAPAGDAIAFGRELAEAGIGVRPFPGLPHAGDCIRVTVGPWPMMERLLARTKEIMKQ